MVKMSIIGRLSDGLPLAQSPMFMNEENSSDVSSSSYYRQQGELVLKEISRGALSNPRMSILIDHHCFHYIIGNGVCCITLCESWYPRKLAFYFLQDVLLEFEKVDIKLVESFSNPYAFKRFGYVMGNIRKKYLDTRTQSNLAKLKADPRQDLDIITQEFSKVINLQKLSSGMQERTEATFPTELTLWNSKLLEVIALKWTPVTVFLTAIGLLLWTSIILSEYHTIITL